LTYLNKKGFKVNVKSNKKILNEAIKSGCKTVAELAFYLKRYQHEKNINQ